jgi:hypothetical protein
MNSLVIYRFYLMMKKLLAFIIKPKGKKRETGGVKINLNKFKEDLHEKLSKVETKTFLYDYQQSIGYIYTADTIDYEKALKNRKENMDKLNEVMEKAKEAEGVINSSFFNDSSLFILNNTDNKDLIALLVCRLLKHR